MYFPEMLISGKGKYFHVFGCISKNFPENIFWCLEKKKEKTNSRKISSTIAIQDRDLVGAIDASRDRALIAISIEGEIAINYAISRQREIAPSIAIFTAIVGLEINAAWSSESTGDRRTDCSVSSPLTRARSLSLSISLSLSFSGNALKWKWGEKIISGSKVKILVNRKSFSGKYHFPWQPNMQKRVKMISWNHFHPKQTHP